MTMPKEYTSAFSVRPPALSSNISGGAWERRCRVVSFVWVSAQSVIII